MSKNATKTTKTATTKTKAPKGKTRPPEVPATKDAAPSSTPLEASPTAIAPKAKKAAKAKAPKADRKLSCIGAAAKVLGESGEAMNTKQMIEQMAAKKYWSSPAGQTPGATLYAALLREITTKGKESRFRRTDKGMFALNG